MKRRPQPDDESRTPLRLRRFDPEEWNALTTLECAGQWWDAREAWEREHGEVADLDDSYPVPDAPFDPESI